MIYDGTINIYTHPLLLQGSLGYYRSHVEAYGKALLRTKRTSRAAKLGPRRAKEIWLHKMWNAREPVSIERRSFINLIRYPWDISALYAHSNKILLGKYFNTVDWINITSKYYLHFNNGIIQLWFGAYPSETTINTDDLTALLKSHTNTHVPTAMRKASHLTTFTLGHVTGSTVGLLVWIARPVSRWVTWRARSSFQPIGVKRRF